VGGERFGKSTQTEDVIKYERNETPVLPTARIVIFDFHSLMPYIAQYSLMCLTPSSIYQSPSWADNCCSAG
jgi:hypothetical protein